MLIGFYGISTTVGHLMPNLVYIYIYIKYIGLVNTYKLYKLEFICLHTAK